MREDMERTKIDGVVYYHWPLTKHGLKLFRQSRARKRVSSDTVRDQENAYKDWKRKNDIKMRKNISKLQWPIKNNGAQDGRYSITKEFTGNFNNLGQPDFVFRFCDEFISSFTNYEDAKQAAINYNETRQKDLKA